MKSTPRYYIAGLLFSILWASASVAGKIGLLSAEGLLLFIVRFILAGGILLAYATIAQRDRLPQKKEWLQLTIFGALNTSVYLGVFIIALEEVTAGITAIAVALNPLLISLMSALWANRPVKKMEWISILIGMTGVVIAAYPLLTESHASITGLLLLAFSMVAYSMGAVYYAGISWALSKTAVNGWQALIGGILLIPAGFLFHTRENHLDLRFWLSAAWLILPVSIGAIQLWLHLLKSDAVKASIWLFLVPIFGLAFSSILLDEPFTIFTAVGTSLVLLALLLGQQGKPAQQKE